MLLKMLFGIISIRMRADGLKRFRLGALCDAAPYSPRYHFRPRSSFVFHGDALILLK